MYERYADKLIAIALKKTAGEEDAMDMVQELFMSVWKNKDTIQLTGSLEAYLVVSINYMVFKWYKKQKSQPLSLDNIPEEQGHGEDNIMPKLIFSELNLLVNAEINNMPEKMRQVYLYSREMDMNGRQIAAELGISHQTVRNQISSALDRIKKAVKKYNNMVLLTVFTAVNIYFLFR